MKKSKKSLISRQRWDKEHPRVALRKETVGRLKQLGRYEDTLDSIVSSLLDESPSGKTAAMVPLLGNISAGPLNLAEQYVEDWIPVPRSKVKNNEGVIFLRVKGDSMIDDHILDGDLVLVKPQPIAENGDIVVAVIESEATVKRFYKEKDHIRLQPSNPNYKPIILQRDFVISGKVIGLLRL